MKISLHISSNSFHDTIMMKALVCSYSYVNGRSVDAKAFFLLQMRTLASTHRSTLSSTLMSTYMSTLSSTLMSTYMSTLSSTLMSTYMSIRMNTPKISTLIHSTLIQGSEV